MAEKDDDDLKDKTESGDGDDGEGKQPDPVDAPDPTIEERARLYGWTPQSEFKGDPKKWIGPEEYVGRAETILPIANAAKHKLEREVLELRKTVSDLNDYHTKNAERASKRHAAELAAAKAAQRKAAEAGDVEQYDALTTKVDALQAEAPEAPAKPKVKPAPEDEIPAFVEWHKSNRWYQDDIEMTDYADRAARVIGRRGYEPDDPAFYAEVANEVRKKFPQKFSGNGTQRPRVPAVEGTNGSGGRGGARKRSFEALPADAKAACLQFEKTIPGFKRDDYVANYEFED